MCCDENEGPCVRVPRYLPKQLGVLFATRHVNISAITGGNPKNQDHNAYYYGVQHRDLGPTSIINLMAFSAWSAENRIPSPECPKCEVRGARCEGSVRAHFKFRGRRQGSEATIRLARRKCRRWGCQGAHGHWWRQKQQFLAGVGWEVRTYLGI